MGADRNANDLDNEGSPQIMPPRLYSRVTCPNVRFLDVMEPGVWMSTTQLAGRLSKYIAPECAIRRFRKNHKYAETTEDIDVQVQGGVRSLTVWWGSAHLTRGRVRKKRMVLITSTEDAKAEAARMGQEAHFCLTKKGRLYREKKINQT